MSKYIQKGSAVYVRTMLLYNVSLPLTDPERILGFITYLVQIKAFLYDQYDRK
jgi:hypothetical protein